MQHIEQHTERTQLAHNMHTHRTQNTDTTIMQHTEDNTEQNKDTETNNPAQDNAQPQHKTTHSYSHI